MGRLVRMPIVYVVLVVAVALAYWAFPRGPAHPPSPSTVVTAAPPPPVPVASPVVQPDAPPEPEPQPAADHILRNSEGLRRKVLVSTLGARAMEQPSTNASKAVPLDYFSIHFVRGVTPPGGEVWYLVGPESGEPTGWVPSREVLEWDSRLMAVPTPRSSRSTRLQVFRQRDCLIARVEHTACKLHAGGPCPLEAEEALDSSAADPALLGMPVLASESLNGPDGNPVGLHEVACMVRDLAPLPAPTEPPDELLQPLKQVYLAFVIDTTQSMQGPIEAVRSLATRLSQESDRSQSGLVYHLALVEYRDRSRAFGYITRRLTDFTTPRQFAVALSSLSSSSEGDGSTAESVLAGIAAALPGGAGAASLSWPTGIEGQAATQLLVLLGDAPDHEQDLQVVRRLAAQARGARIGIAAVQLEPPPERQVLSRSEQRLYREQWQTLAHDSFRPTDGENPAAPLLLNLPLGPENGNAEPVAAISQGITRLLQDRLKHALAEAARRQDELERSRKEITTPAQEPIDRLAPVLVDTHSQETVPKARPDPRVGGLRAPSLRRGWVAQELDGTRLVQLEVLMTRNELDALIREFLAVESAAQSGGELADALLGITTAAAAGETTFLSSDRGSLTFDEHLRRSRGLPPGRPDSLLHRTRADLLQADRLTRAALSERLSASVARMVRHRESIDWVDPGATMAGMALVPYDWIDL